MTLSLTHAKKERIGTIESETLKTPTSCKRTSSTFFLVMGNILRLLSRDGDSCCSMPKSGDLFVDFENAKPTEDEAELYNDAESILARSGSVLADLQSYKGASKEIRQAIMMASPESEAAAWAAVLPLVQKLRSFYLFSKELNTVFPKILLVLCSRASLGTSLAEQLDDHQALVKQLAKVLEFVLKFDETKMTTPAVQNDFSYYRRTVQRNRGNRVLHPECTTEREAREQEAEEIPLDLANEMSLFFADATPMLNALSRATTGFVRDNESIVANNTTDMLSVVAKVCQKMLDTPELKSRLQFEETELFILRVMVATIILYDHVHPTGAFAKGKRGSTNEHSGH